MSTKKRRFFIYDSWNSGASPQFGRLARPVIAEAIVNAVAHRNYRHNGFVQIIVYADRIEVWNPGELPPGLTPDLLRNPHIVAAFRRLGLCEQAGTGIRMVLNQ